MLEAPWAFHLFTCASRAAPLKHCTPSTQLLQSDILNDVDIALKVAARIFNLFGESAIANALSTFETDVTGVRASGGLLHQLQ